MKEVIHFITKEQLLSNLKAVPQMIGTTHRDNVARLIAFEISLSNINDSFKVCLLGCAKKISANGSSISAKFAKSFSRPETISSNLKFREFDKILRFLSFLKLLQEF